MIMKSLISSVTKKWKYVKSKQRLWLNNGLKVMTNSIKKYNLGFVVGWNSDKTIKISYLL